MRIVKLNHVTTFPCLFLTKKTKIHKEKNNSKASGGITRMNNNPLNNRSYLQYSFS